jgi:hypothetical protein
MRILKIVLALSLMTTFIPPLSGESDHDAKKKFPSPDGKFAFQYGKGEAGEENDEEAEVFNLIEARSGKMLLEVAKSDPDFGPSGRFEMEVLWRPDSKAFAVTATFNKRGSTLLVFVRKGTEFHAIDLPELEVEITDKARQGKTFAKTTEINSQSAKRWQKDGSLVAEIATQEDGGYGSIRATRTVVLVFDKIDKARVLKSTIKFAIKKG